MRSDIMHTTAVNANHVPAFLTKLWRLVEDNKCDELICWSSGGTTFIIRDQSRFSKELLPMYFKHSNMASFVRQLNMYGFRKVVGIEQGGLRAEKDEIEFQHMYFLKGHEYLLELIKRKISMGKGAQEEMKIRPELVNKMLIDVKLLYGKQETFDGQLSNLKSENEVLWREVANLREQHKKQQQIVNKLIHFLLSLVHHNHRLGVRRKVPLMLDDASPAKSPRYGRSFSMEGGNGTRIQSDLQSSGAQITDVSSPSGPVIRDITDTFDTEAFLTGDVDGIPNVQVDSPSFLIKNDEDVAGTSNSEDSKGTPSSVEVDSSEQPTGETNNLVDLIQVINSSNDVNGTSAVSDDVPAQTSDIQVSVVDKELDKAHFENHLDSLQHELDALKDMFSGSGCTIDPTALLGLFSSDDGKNMMDSFVDFSGRSTSNGNEIVGTELTQYNPNSVLSFLDEDEPIFDAESILPNVEGDSCLNSSLFECIESVEADDKADPEAVEISLPDTSNDDSSFLVNPTLASAATLSPLSACTAEIFNKTPNESLETN